jgi:putative glutamine amidotransferase
MTEMGGKTGINTAYIDYIIGAGFVPILVSNNEKVVKPCLENADALVLPGGIDVDPTYYGEENQTSFSVSREKDDFERKLFECALAKKIPIFGICRGHQLIGYEIEQRKLGDIPLWVRQHVSNHDQNDQNVDRPLLSHKVVCSKALYGGESFEFDGEMFVNSMHHQAVVAEKTVALETVAFSEMGVEILAYTERGCSSYSKSDPNVVIIEAMMIPEMKTLSVQWHPEELADYDLLRSALTNW